MEDNVVTKTNTMDLMPDELVVKIIEHSENMNDLLILPKINKRFYRLSKERCNRKHLIIKGFKMDGYSREEILKEIENELNKCKNLESVSCLTSAVRPMAPPPEKNIEMIFLGSVRPLFVEALKRNTTQDIKEDDVCDIIICNIKSDFFNAYLNKSADKSCSRKIIHLVPSDITNIRVYGAPETFQAVVMKSTDTLGKVNFRGTHVTAAHLKAIGDCKNMKWVKLKGDLLASEIVPETVQIIPACYMVLEGNFRCKYVPDLFFSEILEDFTVSLSTIDGFENELFNKCPILKELTLSLKSERENMTKDHFVASVVKLIDVLKNHKTLQRISIPNAGTTLVEPLKACLESVANSSFYACSAEIHSTITIGLNGTSLSML